MLYYNARSTILVNRQDGSLETIFIKRIETARGVFKGAHDVLTKIKQCSRMDQI